MKPLSVVEHFYMPEEVRPRFVMRPVFSPVDAFLLRCPEEAFHRRIVPAVPLPAHRTDDPVSPERFPVFIPRVLTPTVRVQDQPDRRFPVRHGPVERFLHERRVYVRACRPSHDASRRQVHDRCRYSHPSPVAM